MCHIAGTDDAVNLGTDIENISKIYNPIHYSCIIRYMWAPHKLNKIQLTKRISICDSLLKHNEIDPF